jgi:hypothetical protein
VKTEHFHQAEATTEVVVIARIANAGKRGDWRADAWLAERRWWRALILTTPFRGHTVALAFMHASLPGGPAERDQRFILEHVRLR